ALIAQFPGLRSSDHPPIPPAASPLSVSNPLTIQDYENMKRVLGLNFAAQLFLSRQGYGSTGGDLFANGPLINPANPGPYHDTAILPSSPFYRVPMPSLFS